MESQEGIDPGRRPAPLERATRGRWLGGVCAGIAQARAVPVSAVRAAFVLGAAIGGLGALVYLTCWLIVPAEGELARGGAGPAGPRGVATLALACGGALGLGTLGVVGAVATVFGFGWMVVVVAVAILVGALASWRRLGPAWALLPVAALVLPSVALAVGGVRVAAQAGDLRFSPLTTSEIPKGGYESGLGTMLVDLRRTRLPAGGDVHLRVRAGVRRTIVALPHDRCVQVDVDYHVRTFAARAGALLTNNNLGPYSDVGVFDQHLYQRRGRWGNVDPRRRAPVLHVSFASAGGSLYVRDYPDDLDPESMPGWPGYPPGVESRPDVGGLSRKEAKGLLRGWRARRRDQVATQRRYERLRYGPCGDARAGRTA